MKGVTLLILLGIIFNEKGWGQTDAAELYPDAPSIQCVFILKQGSNCNIYGELINSKNDNGSIQVSTGQAIQLRNNTLEQSSTTLYLNNALSAIPHKVTTIGTNPGNEYSAWFSCNNLSSSTVNLIFKFNNSKHPPGGFNINTPIYSSIELARESLGACSSLLPQS